jgi:hypothetical protein
MKALCMIGLIVSHGLDRFELHGATLGDDGRSLGLDGSRGILKWKGQQRQYGDAWEARGGWSWGEGDVIG